MGAAPAHSRAVSRGVSGAQLAQRSAIIMQGSLEKHAPELFSQQRAVRVYLLGCAAAVSGACLPAHLIL